MNNKKKILFIVTRGGSLGGVQIHILDILKDLLKKDIETMVCLGDICKYEQAKVLEESPFIKNLEKLGIKYFPIRTLKHEINPIGDFKSILELIKTIKNFKPNLICLHSTKAGILGRIAAKITSTPAIYTIHGWCFSTKKHFLINYIYFLIEKFAYFITDKFIVISDYDLNFAVNKGFNEKKMIKIHNSRNFKINSRKDVEKNNKIVNIISVARFEAQKDHITLLKSLNMIKNNKKWRCTLLGDGPKINQVKYLAKEFGLQDRVIFKGFIDNVGSYLSDSDIFVLSTNWEGLPITLIEAAAHGLPIISTDVGGCPEVVYHGLNGFIYPFKSHKHLSYFLKELIKKPELMKKMSQSSKLVYDRKFLFKNFIKKTYEVYNSTSMSLNL